MDRGPEIAIVGRAGRFPRARSVEELWCRLAAGDECISFFSEAELLAAGVAREALADPAYVRAAGILDGVEQFDAEFFGMTPKEAEITDPQQRFFLECAWEALEDAGYDPASCKGPVGVFAGMSMSRYLLTLAARSDLVDLVGNFRVRLGNEKDYLPTWTSYRLDLRGPSVNVQTACSTSLVAVHLACQSLLAYECDMALAGGVSIRTLRRAGYLFHEGGINSPDGHCRAFDAQARGTVTGDGVGVVVLKRLADALVDGAFVHAVIKGSAINNDGGRKVGFTAPSVDGQARVISEAMALAGVEPTDICYVEAHGTGTPLGDPVEIAALSRAFRNGRRRTCGVGSLKTNVGHLDAAAGVAGLIKVVEALKRRELPPSLHFERPNPAIDFDAGPFYINTNLTSLAGRPGPLRAGVSSFGIGGTNAHVVVEEAPPRVAALASGSASLLVVSARSPAALEVATTNLAAHLRRHLDLDPKDVAFTLQVGRRAFRHRRALVCRTLEEAAALLESADPRRLPTAEVPQGAPRAVAFLFPGQGAQHAGMAGELYAAEPRYREELDRSAELLAPHLGLDLRTVLFPPAGEEAEASRRLERTALAQPALFAVEHALARLWMAWGLSPEVMIGHSIGEYVAACLAGVFSLEDALALVATRGRLMQEVGEGVMLAVPLSETEVEPLLGGGLDLAAVNGPARCVVSGPVAAVAALERRLVAADVACRRLHTSHAFHSAMMDPVLAPFLERVEQVERKPPRIPFVSNLTGAPITADEATRPGYWVEHLRRPVRFGQGLTELLREPGRILLEVGPGSTLRTLARQHPDCATDRLVLQSLPHPREGGDAAFLLGTLGRLWLASAPVRWPAVHVGSGRRRLPLPTYPFERRRFWIEPGKSPAAAARRRDAVADWLYLPSWRRSQRPLAPAEPAGRRHRWLLLLGRTGPGARLAERLERAGGEVVTATLGDRFARTGECCYVLDRHETGSYQALVRSLAAEGRDPDVVVHLACLDGGPAGELDPARFAAGQDLGFHALLSLAQALEAVNRTEPLRLVVVANGLHQVTGGEDLYPEKSTLLGPCLVLPQEYPNLACRSVDVELPAPGSCEEEELLDLLAAECAAPSPDAVVAYRGRFRWVQAYERAAAAPLAAGAGLRQGGVYLVTGGLGRVGLVIAGHLARAARARLVLTRRSPFPPREEWDGWVAAQREEDSVRRTIERLRELERLGAEVEVAAADVADREEMRRLLDRVKARFGSLHGVIHCAGVVGARSFSTVRETGSEEAAAQFRPKAEGLLVLEELLRDEPPELWLLVSSLSTVLGGLGFAAYSAANLFLDATAEARAGSAPGRWLSIAWDGWSWDEAPPGARTGILPSEGGEALARVLALGEAGRVVVSTSDLAARAAEWARRETPAEEPAAGPGRRREDGARGAPSGTVEDTILKLWRNLLGVEAIGCDDDFFELGGDSLLATQLLAKLRQATGVAVPLRAVFETPTIAGLAALVAAAGEQREGPAPIVAGARPVDLPLSFSQQRLWFLEQLESATAYNTFAAFRLEGRLDRVALAWSLGEIVHRHEALRTVFPAVDGRPVQVVTPPRPVPLPIIDLRALPAVVREGEARLLAAAQSRRRFDLARGPLIANTLLQLGEAEHVVLIAVHHIVCDGWSVAVFVRELRALYVAFTAGTPSPLPALPVQYADYTLWQRDWLTGEVLEGQLAYWRRQLADLRDLELPLDHPRPARQSFRGATETLHLSGSLTRELRRLAQRLSATLFMTLLAGFKVLLQRYTGEDDLVVGTNVANRTRGELEELIGFFVNNLVLRTDLSGDPTFEEVVRRVREVSLAAFAHQDLPFERLVEELRPQRQAGRQPLFQVIFVLQIAPGETLELPGLALSTFKVDRQGAAFDLLLNMQEKDEGMIAVLEYNTDLFERATVKTLLGRFAVLLEAVAADPGRQVSTLSLAGDAEEEAELIRGFSEDLAEIA